MFQIQSLQVFGYHFLVLLLSLTQHVSICNFGERVAHICPQAGPIAALCRQGGECTSLQPEKHGAEKHCTTRFFSESASQRWQAQYGMMLFSITMLKSIEYMLKSMVMLKHTVWHDAFQHQDEKYLVHAETPGDAENNCTT